MFKKYIVIVISLILLSVSVSAEDQQKEMKKNWDNVLKIYNAGSETKESFEALDNFSKRWKDNNRFRAARAKYLEGMTYYRGKKYTQAYNQFEELKKDFSGSPYVDSAIYKMGECKYNMGNYTEAIDIWSNFRYRYQKSLFTMESVYGMALAYLNLEEYKKADRELQWFLGRDPHYKDDDAIKLIGGVIDYYLERYEDANKKLKRLKDDVAYYYNGHALMHMKKYPEAASSFKRISIHYPESKYLESAIYNKAEAFFLGEKYDVASTDYATFVKKFPNSTLEPYSAFKKGSSLFLNREYKKARIAYRKVINGPGDMTVRAYAQYLVGECYRKENNYKLALTEYNKVLTNFDKVYDVLASAQLRAGWCYGTLGKYEKSEEVLRAFSQKFVTHEGLPLGYYLLGNAHYKKKEYGLAIERYRYLLQKFAYSNLSEAALLMLSMSYYQQEEYGMLASEVSHSIAQLSRKFKDPEGKNIRARTYFYLGQAYFKKGLYGPAAKAFKIILDQYYESDITTEARANLAWCYYELENYKGARTMARDVINSSYADKKVKKAAEILIAHSFFSEKEYDRASAKYQEFAYTYRKSKDFELTAEALFQQGKVYEYMESYGDAIESWRAVAVNYPKSKRAAEATFKMSDVYFKAQQFDKAILGFQTVIETWPKSEFAEDATLSIAEVYYNSGKEAKAVAAYKAFLKKYPDSTKITSVEEGMERASYVKAEKLGDPDQLLAYYEKYPSSNMAVNALYNAAEIYYKNSKFKQSIDTFNKLIEEFPNDSFAVNAHYYIPACYTELKQYEDAIAAYRAFLKNYPKHELASEVMFNLATTAFTTKDYVNAIFFYARVLEKYPDSAYANNAMYNSALAYNELGKFDDAIMTYKKFINAYSDDDKAKGLLVYIAGLYHEQKRYADAVKAYENVMEKGTKEEKLQAIYTIGSIYGSREETDKQIEWYNKLITFKPLNNIYRLNGLVDLAGKYEEKQDWVNAVRIYRLVANSGGNKEYVDFAAARIPTIKQAYPDLFKKVAPAKKKTTTKKK